MDRKALLELVRRASDHGAEKHDTTVEADGSDEHYLIVHTRDYGGVDGPVHRLEHAGEFEGHQLVRVTSDDGMEVLVSADPAALFAILYA